MLRHNAQMNNFHVSSHDWSVIKNTCTSSPFNTARLCPSSIILIRGHTCTGENCGLNT